MPYPRLRHKGVARRRKPQGNCTANVYLAGKRACPLPARASGTHAPHRSGNTGTPAYRLRAACKTFDTDCLFLHTADRIFRSPPPHERTEEKKKGFGFAFRAPCANFAAATKRKRMKILFLSDIHGSLPALEAALSYYDRHRFDLLVLLGDLLNYGPRNGLCPGLDPQRVAERLNERARNIVAVRGNCDSEVDQMLLNFPIQATYSLVVDEGRRFFVTHGHVYNEKKLPEGPACDVMVYGHSHLFQLKPADPETGRPILLNTGSPTFPKGGNPPTFATYAQGMLAVRTLDGSAILSLKV